MNAFYEVHFRCWMLNADTRHSNCVCSHEHFFIFIFISIFNRNIQSRIIKNLVEINARKKLWGRRIGIHLTFFHFHVTNSATEYCKLWAPCNLNEMKMLQMLGNVKYIFIVVKLSRVSDWERLNYTNQIVKVQMNFQPWICECAFYSLRHTEYRRTCHLVDNNIILTYYFFLKRKRKKCEKIIQRIEIMKTSSLL